MIAYFDESGKPSDKPIVSLAAIVAPSKNWIRYEFSWLQAMAKFRTAMHPVQRRRYFHMTDYESRKVKPYDQWSEKKRLECIQKLGSTLEGAIVFGTVHSLVVKDWEEVVVPHLGGRSKKRRGWYVFLLQSILEDIAAFVKVPKHETIACIFDENREIGQIAKDHFSGLKAHRADRGWDRIFGTATYGNSVLLSPLQGADILAFEGRLRVENKVLTNDERPIRKLLLRLTENKKITLARYSRERLVKLNDKWTEIKKYLAAANTNAGEI